MRTSKKGLYPSDQRQVQSSQLDNLCTGIIAYEREKIKNKGR